MGNLEVINVLTLKCLKIIFFFTEMKFTFKINLVKSEQFSGV